MFNRPAYKRFINTADEALQAIKIGKFDGTAVPVSLTAANAVTATLTQILIEGLGNFSRESISKVVKVASVAANKKVVTFTLTGSPVAGTTYGLVIARVRDGFKDVEDSGSDRRMHAVTANTGETLTTLAARITALINERLADDGGLASATSAAAVITVTSTYDGQDFDLFTNETLTGTKAVTTPLVRGINTAAQLERLYKPEINTVHNKGYVKFPAPGVSYTQYSFSHTSQLQLGSRETPSEFKSNQQEFHLYINKDLATAIAALDALVGAADVADNVADVNVTAGN